MEAPSSPAPENTKACSERLKNMSEAEVLECYLKEYNRKDNDLRLFNARRYIKNVNYSISRLDMRKKASREDVIGLENELKTALREVRSFMAEYNF